MARRRISIGSVEGDGEDEAMALGKLVSSSPSSSARDSSSSDEESAISQPAFACSNKRRVSVTVDTLTHSSPP